LVAQADDFTRRELELAGWALLVETYRVGGAYYTTVSSADAGARFSRGEGSTREESERIALEKAEKWLRQTRRFPGSDPDPNHL
jgi:hypothetical protein